MSGTALPAEGCIDLWLLDGSNPPAGIDAIDLDGEEEARAGRMATAELRARLRRRRRFLRAVLARYLGLAPGDVPLRAAPGGKPALAGETRLRFSLSHSGELTVLAVGRTELGVDLEQRKPFDRLAEVVAHSCSSRERAAIAAAPDAATAFLDRWVVKEAVLKCRGTGLVEDLAGIDPGPVSREPRDWQGLTIRKLRPPALPSGPDLHMALAVEGPAERIAWRGLESPVAIPFRLSDGTGSRWAAPLTGEGILDIAPPASRTQRNS
ncbi:4'-phosphopantetheinyl transferase family protein [Aureimonas pseudogalii]|uniref:4'-phosphopantetheinyl transferase n=1 Tax=Aureimonas pseudogalii TaxID=1744844 RepID=A0A7W6E9G3_9HYPH|nr:4'-phosphopantetheinyl transferase superfamily protein [Aureimonas pseudogalii]MBB3996744.1 4'-phosphopantetheinyl transferase [Aureimonas pseudogalii]